MRYMRFVRQIPASLRGPIGRLSSLCEEEGLLRGGLGRFPERGERAARDSVLQADKDRPHSALMFAARITLPHFSVSSAMSLPKSAGEPTNAVPPSSASRALILGSARPALISWLSLPMISVGVLLGAPIATNALASKPGRNSLSVGTFGS